MINLLPEDYKKELRAARSNVVLLRYNFALLSIVGFLLLSILVVLAVLGTSQVIAESTKEANEAKASQYADIKKQADEYRQNLETAKKILANDVAYTKIAFEIAELLPDGVVLDSLTLNAKEFGTPTLLNTHAKSYETASELKRVFEASPLFSNVHFQSIVAEANGANTNYPLSVTINVIINKAAVK